MTAKKTYEVFVVTCVGVRLDPVEARSPEEALKTAVGKVDWNELFPSGGANVSGVVHVNGHWDGHHAALVTNPKTHHEVNFLANEGGACFVRQE
jgi:hypothetical protein